MQRRKTIELRTWKTNYRGLLAIHAGKTVETGFLKKYALKADNLQTGVIVGTVEITEIIDFTQELWEKLRNQHLNDSRSPGDWKGWMLRNSSRLSEPVPYRGIPGLFNIPKTISEKMQYSDGSKVCE